MKYAFLTIFLIFNFFAGEIFSKTASEVTWKSLLKEHANCVTWISATVRLEVSVGGRSMPPQEQNSKHWAPLSQKMA